MKKFIVSALVMFPAAALAHSGHHHNEWLDGFLHPLTGLDHLLALLATGFWLAQSGTRYKPGFIAGFCAVLAVAVVAGMGFPQFTFEAGIVASLVVLGSLLAAAVRGPLVLRAGVVIATAAVHGFVHGTELPASGSVIPFIIGLVLCSGLVVTAATLVGVQANNVARGLVARVAGVALVLTGFAMGF